MLMVKVQAAKEPVQMGRTREIDVGLHLALHKAALLDGNVLLLERLDVVVANELHGEQALEAGRHKVGQEGVRRERAETGDPGKMTGQASPLSKKTLVSEAVHHDAVSSDEEANRNDVEVLEQDKVLVQTGLKHGKDDLRLDPHLFGRAGSMQASPPPSTTLGIA